MRRIVTGFGALAVVVALTAGCTAAAKEPAGVTANPTATAIPTPTATSTPTPTSGVVVETSDPTLGIVFDAAPAMSGDAADVYNWIAVFEKEYWRTFTTNTFSPGLDVFASAEVNAGLKSVLAGNVQNGDRIGGVLHVRVDGITVHGDTASGTACEDYAQVTFADAVKSYTPQEASFGEPRLMEMSLSRVSAENRWMITTLMENGTC